MNEILVVKIPVKKKGESVHMKKVVAMYEQEEAYGKNLAEYVNRKENMPFELQVFSQADKLSDYLQGHTPQLLLLSEENSLESYGDMCKKTQDVLYLTEHKDQARDQKGNHIYKYQPTDQLLNQLMQHMSDHEKRDSPVMQESCPIYGVYSPVGRCGKTTFSLLLGELLARKRSVLYIGFDELPFWDEEENTSEEQGEKGTLSDAYFYWQRQKLKEKLPALVSHWHGVDVLTGMNCPEDLCAIQPEEWSQLILKIAQETEYAAIVLDIGSKLWLADSMFSMCSQLYVPVLSERLAKDLQEEGLNAFYGQDSDRILQPGEIMVAYGHARRGFEYPLVKFAVITETDIFGKEQKKRKKKKREEMVVSPSLNFAVAKYYKGTGIEEVLKKMEKHLDEASKEESQINNI